MCIFTCIHTYIRTYIYIGSTSTIYSLHSESSIHRIEKKAISSLQYNTCFNQNFSLLKIQEIRLSGKLSFSCLYIIKMIVPQILNLCGFRRINVFALSLLNQNAYFFLSSLNTKSDIHLDSVSSCCLQTIR